MDVTQIAGPVVLFLLMVIIGLELTPDDFRRVLAAPRAVVGGTLAQIVLLPLLTWAVVTALGVNPVFGAGAVLLSDQVDGDGRVPVATRLNDVKFKRQVRPGDTIAIRVTIDDRLADAMDQVDVWLGFFGAWSPAAIF